VPKCAQFIKPASEETAAAIHSALEHAAETSSAVAENGGTSNSDISSRASNILAAFEEHMKRAKQVGMRMPSDAARSRPLVHIAHWMGCALPSAPGALAIHTTEPSSGGVRCNDGLTRVLRCAVRQFTDINARISKVRARLRVLNVCADVRMYPCNYTRPFTLYLVM
jgi:hypothetical protein